MLNITAVDGSNHYILEDSYNAIKNKEQLEILTDEKEKQKIFVQTIDNIKMRTNTSLSFQNLFKLSCTNGVFYMAQCLVNLGYPIGSHGSQTFDQKYYYQLIGIANLTVDLGISNMRTETKLDKITDRFFHNDIDFDGAEKFNDQYFLTSNNKEAIRKYFDKNFLNAIARQNDVLLVTNGKQMFVSFNESLNDDHSRIVENILSNFKWLAKH